MDCLDFQSARCFHGKGKELASVLQSAGIGFLDAEIGENFSQALVIDADPLRERIKYPCCHIGGSGFCISKRQNFIGRDALQHQADDALNQHMRFTRAGIGGDPDRGLRVGGQMLKGGCLCDAGFAECFQPVGRSCVHHASPSCSPSAHSLTRARWS